MKRDEGQDDRPQFANTTAMKFKLFRSGSNRNGTSRHQAEEEPATHVEEDITAPLSPNERIKYLFDYIDEDDNRPVLFTYKNLQESMATETSSSMSQNKWSIATVDAEEASSSANESLLTDDIDHETSLLEDIASELRHETRRLWNDANSLIAETIPKIGGGLLLDFSLFEPSATALRKLELERVAAAKRLSTLSPRYSKKTGVMKHDWDHVD